MSVNFKIFFKTSHDEDNVVLMKGDLFNYDWKSLREAIIQNSQLPYFQSKALTLNNNDIFILELSNPPKNELSKINFIHNEFTFSYLISILKEELKEDLNHLKLKFTLEKRDKEPNSDMPKYFNYLKNVLNDTWKIEKENIKTELNDIALNESQMNFIYSNLNENNKNSKNNKKFKIENNNIIVCNNCLSKTFYKFRYICSYCDNFNLCYKCYKKYEHNKQHNFIIFNVAKTVNDITKYDNKISPNYIELKGKKEHFDVQFRIANTGEVDLKGCFIGYIKFDKNYLICNKYEIKDGLEKNDIKEVQLKIHFNDTDNIDINTFEGHFRMFNSYGIPFGDILKIKVINEPTF